MTTYSPPSCLDDDDQAGRGNVEVLALAHLLLDNRPGEHRQLVDPGLVHVDVVEAILPMPMNPPIRLSLRLRHVTLVPAAALSASLSVSQLSVAS